jgi:3-dehydrotetronate 4-kinase
VTLGGLQIGAIADDLTGATDLASALARAGLRVAVSAGVPGAGADELDGLDALVVALKIRSAPAADAVGEALSAADFLLGAGAVRLYFKYSSTFDSGPRGNIGPVADALAERTGSELAVVCPAFPRLGRTVYQGHLFVGDQLLNRAGLGDHPLTPHLESSVVALMAAQTHRGVGLLPLPVVRDGPAAIVAGLAGLRAEGLGYAVLDAVTDADLVAVAAACVADRLLTGSAGIAFGLAAILGPAGSGAERVWVPPGSGPAAILSGSCSETTRRQVSAFARRGGAVLRLDPDALSAHAVADAIDWASARLRREPVLISSLRADGGRPADRPGAAAAMEAALAMIARGIYDRGFRRFVVAGGETSGAVVAALGAGVLEVGPELSAGVSWMAGGDGRDLLLALKSGNFGDDELLVRAAQPG